MTQEIKIDFENFTCSIAITDFPLIRIKNLSGIPNVIAEQLADVSAALGLQDGMKEALMKEALAGTLTKRGICQAIASGLRTDTALKT